MSVAKRSVESLLADNEALLPMGSLSADSRQYSGKKMSANAKSTKKMATPRTKRLLHFEFVLNVNFIAQ